MQAELMTGKPLLPGMSDIDQLHLQLLLLGPLPPSLAMQLTGTPHNAQQELLPRRMANLKDWYALSRCMALGGSTHQA